MEDSLGLGTKNFSSFLQHATNVSSRDTSEENVLEILMIVEVYCMPLIFSFGLMGNTLSAVTFFRAPFRKTSCSVYLGVLSVSDNGFLLALLLIWISSVFDLRLSQVTGVCQTVVFLTYIWLCEYLVGGVRYYRNLCADLSPICYEKCLCQASSAYLDNYAVHILFRSI